jgi:hypothetical protein
MRISQALLDRADDACRGAAAVREAFQATAEQAAEMRKNSRECRELLQDFITQLSTALATMRGDGAPACRLQLLTTSSTRGCNARISAVDPFPSAPPCN